MKRFVAAVSALQQWRSALTAGDRSGRYLCSARKLLRAVALLLKSGADGLHETCAGDVSRPYPREYLVAGVDLAFAVDHPQAHVDSGTGSPALRAEIG